MEFIDTHAHLYADAFDEDRETMIQRALDQGIKHIFLPNIDVSSLEPMLDMEKKWPGICFPQMGLHPCSVKEDYKEQLSVMKTWLEKRPFCAIGEMGMDLHWDLTYKKEQVDAFMIQCEWAVAYDLPIVIHSRKATQEVIDLLKGLGDQAPKGVFHCFGGTIPEARQIIDLGFYLGIGGVVTFKNAGLKEILAKVPLTQLVLETDSPYLAPTPNRGKRNESSFIRQIAAELASIYEESEKKIAEVTTLNAKKLYPKAFEKQGKARNM